jgi:hypothetical protein
VELAVYILEKNVCEESLCATNIKTEKTRLFPKLNFITCLSVDRKPPNDPGESTGSKE